MKLIPLLATALLFAFGACTDTQASDTHNSTGAVAPTADQVRVSIELPGMD